MNILGKVTMPVTRYQAGSWGTDGEWNNGPLQAGLSVTASVQPITPELMEDLPQGDRTSARHVMYALSGETQLITVSIAGRKRADRVTFQGRDYMCQSIGNWSAHTTGLPHQEYVMLAVGDDE